MKKLHFILLLSVFLPYNRAVMSKETENKDSILASAQVSFAGMQAENERLEQIAQNLANANVTGTNPKQNPYRRKVPLLKNVYDKKLGVKIPKISSVQHDKSPFILKYEPNHPAADEKGMVKYPNVNIIIENTDAKEAQRTFEANAYALEIAQSNQKKILDLMR